MSMKVLLADEDWHFAGQMSSYLESHAHLVVRETDCEQIVARTRRWRPDLVIVSAELALGDLLETLNGLEHRPAVLLAGKMDRYDLAWRAWQKGGDELLMKPIFRDDELHLAIVMALENATAGRRWIRPATASA